MQPERQLSGRNDKRATKPPFGNVLARGDKSQEREGGALAFKGYFFLDYATDCNELAGVIERFVAGTSRGIEWDVYSLGKSYKDPFLASIQQRMLSVCVEFPPGSKTEYTNPEGIAVLRGLAQELRSRACQ